MTRAAEVIRLTFPACTLTQRRFFRAVQAGGGVVVLAAEDSVDAVRDAQRHGVLRALVSRPAQ